VVVRQTPDGTIVEAIDPAVLVRFSGNDALEPVAAEVGRALAAAMSSLDKEVLA